jgi:hypothetical protein
MGNSLVAQCQNKENARFKSTKLFSGIPLQETFLEAEKVDIFNTGCHLHFLFSTG